MCLLFILLAIACTFISISFARLCAAIRSICRQLEEIGDGSHMELAADTRQKALLELCRDLNRILSGRDRSRIQYERAEKQLKQNITNLAHDIRTPLTGASGYLQLARECDDTARRDYYLSTAGRRLAELADMLDKLFLYTKLVNEDFTFPGENMKKMQVLPLLGDCLLSFYAQFEELGIEPEVLFESEGFRVLADEDAMRRIFMNLLQNALLHGAGGLTIIQKTACDTQGSREEGTCRTAVMPSAPSRTAAGQHILPQNPHLEKGSCGCLIFENPIPEDTPLDVAQLFDLFYKADLARRKGSSGLGLFIVRELMRRMGGDAAGELDGNMLRIILYFPPDGPAPMP